MTHKSNGFKKNFIYQISYQFVILIIPLITAPYLTRTLGDTSLGNYTFTYSIVTYFMILSQLGIARHGLRVIATRKSDEYALRKTFWSLFYIHVFLSLVSILIYSLFALSQKDLKLLYLIQGIYIISTLFDITWLFYGLENFKSVVIKNLIIKLVETCLVFILVKSPGDLPKYALITAISTCIGQMIMLPQAIKIVKPIKFGLQDVKEHIKPMLILSLTVIATTLYTIFDKTLLGILSTKENVAYYEYSNKIINIPKSIIIVIGTVLFPKACVSFANEDFKTMKKYLNNSIKFIYFIGIGSMFGLFAVSDLFIEIYYGIEFISCANIVKLMSPLIILISLSEILRTQLMLPMKKDMTYTVILIFSAIINIILSLILIPKIGVYGAIIGTISAEIISTLIQLIICKKFIDFKTNFMDFLPFFLSGIVMYISISIIKNFYNSSLIHLILQVLIGGVFYIIIIMIWYIMIKKCHQYKERRGI